MSFNEARQHLPEYLIEAAGLGVFMVMACGFGALLEHPASVGRQLIDNDDARRVLMGLAMGLTVITLVYSPWGKRSGAHLNPAVTLTFWRLGKVKSADACFYIAAQFIGAAFGVRLSAALWPSELGHPAVHFVTTLPGHLGVSGAFAAEFAISFGLMSVVLRVSTQSRLAGYTGLCAGALVLTYISLEAPLSGMSMNPARTLASALGGQVWTALWLYFTAPPLAMLVAAQVFLWQRGGAPAGGCAKLHHQNRQRCIHCGKPATSGTTA